MKKKIIYALLAIFTLFGLCWRLAGLRQGYSFWTDEDHVAIFARAILQRHAPILSNGYNTGLYQYLWYWLTALPMALTSPSEFAARLPAVFFGLATILMIYLLGRAFFDPLSGLLASFLVVFLRIEILWSRQARPYQALQFFFLLTAFLLFRYYKSPSRRQKIAYFLGFLLTAVLASLCHGLGLLIFLDGLIFLLLISPSRLLIATTGAATILLSLPFHKLLLAIVTKLGQTNNLFYYRVFLTHHYLPLTILATLGSFWLGYQSLRQPKLRAPLLLLTIPLVIQTLVVSFALGQPFVRYFYITFPFIILLAVSPFFLAKHSAPPKRFLTLSIVSLLLLATLPQLALRPQKYYSLNRDMQEIPEVNWQKIYALVKTWRQNHPQAPLVVNWNDLPIWYLGETPSYLYLLRPVPARRDPLSGARILHSVNELKTLVHQHPTGLVVLDSWDDRIPAGVRQYCRQNLHHEVEVRQLFPHQPHPWPVNIYSWSP